MESAVAQDLLLEENANMLDNIRKKISDVYYEFIDLNWKYFGKVLLVIVPAVLWTVTYYIIKWIYAGAEAQSGNLPEGTLGYIFIPAWLGIVIASVPCARLGALLAYRLNELRLKRLFGLLLIAMAARLIWINLTGD